MDIDWREIVVPSGSLAEIVVRGTLIYLGLLVIMRVVLNREAGNVGMTDMLVVVMIADAAQNGMADDYRSVTEGLVLVATIVGWDYVLDWLALRSKFVRHLVRPPALTLVENGRMNRRNMRRELVNEEELMSLLREQGIEAIEDVERACMEGDGEISVTRRDAPKKRDAGGPAA